MATHAHPGRRPDGHQHAGHGRHRRDRAALGHACPTAAVVMMSVQGEADYLRRSMLAGAREFLVKPFSSDELTASIRQVYARERDKARAAWPRRAAARRAATGDARRRQSGEPGQVVAVFSPKGGVGRTTVAVNLAVAAATELGKKVVLVDGSLPVRRRRRPAQPEPEEQVDRRPRPRARGRRGRVARHASSSTTRPASASCSRRRARRWPSWSRPSGIKQVIEALRHDHDLVVVDCTAVLQRHDAGDPRRRPT